MSQWRWTTEELGLPKDSLKRESGGSPLLTPRSPFDMSSNSLSYIFAARERGEGRKKKSLPNPRELHENSVRSSQVRTLDVWHQASPSPWYWAFRRVYASRSSVSLENSCTKPQGERREESHRCCSCCNEPKMWRNKNKKTNQERANTVNMGCYWNV